MSPRFDSFFAFTDALGRANTKLSYTQVMAIIYHWAVERALKDSLRTLQLSKQVCVNWRHFLREICTLKFQQRERFGGEGHILQVDETLMHGKRKANRGRLMLYKIYSRIAHNQDRRWGAPPQNANQRNHGNRDNGPWCFGIADCVRDGDSLRVVEVRAFLVPDRTWETLRVIFERECLPGSTVHSDDWRRYNRLGESGFTHHVVNHNRNFVAPDGTHTQNIESLWGKLKTKLLKNMKNVSAATIDTHLAEFWYRKKFGSD